MLLLFHLPTGTSTVHGIFLQYTTIVDWSRHSRACRIEYVCTNRWYFCLEMVSSWSQIERHRNHILLYCVFGECGHLKSCGQSSLLDFLFLSHKSFGFITLDPSTKNLLLLLLLLPSTWTLAIPSKTTRNAKHLSANAKKSWQPTLATDAASTWRNTSPLMNSRLFLKQVSESDRIVVAWTMISPFCRICWPFFPFSDCCILITSI